MSYRVSYSGVEETIFNGIEDWLHHVANKGYYGRGTIKASPQGSWMSYLEYDLSATPLMNIPIYGDPFDPTNNQYPDSFNIRYPKSGTTLTVTTMFAYNTDNPGSIPLPVRPPVELNSFSDGIIVASSEWITEGKVQA